MYDVEENPCIKRIMLVRHQDSTDDDDMVTLSDQSHNTDLKIGTNGHPACEIYGYDCECEPKELVKAITRKPIFPNCPDYVAFAQDVPAFNAFTAARGYIANAGWMPIPAGSWGSTLNLEQPNLFGHEYWDEWRFGLAITDCNTGNNMEWCPAAGVTHTDEEGNLTFEYVIDLPDEAINVGQCFTPHVYDATE